MKNDITVPGFRFHNMNRCCEYPQVALLLVVDGSGGNMKTVGSEIDLGFSRKKFHPGTHICLIFRGEVERKKIVSKFIESGILNGEKVSYFVDVAKPSDVVDWLEKKDIDLSQYLEKDAFSITEAVNTYCPDGTFIPERMWGVLKDAYTVSEKEGYSNVRVSGEMTWALRGFPGSNRLIEYEAGINTVVKTHPVTAMCQYDVNEFDGALIYKALQVHPYMVMNGQVVENPYYISGDNSY